MADKLTPQQEMAVTSRGGKLLVSAAAGSGFIFTDDGYIITNYHVIEGANTVTVSTYDGTQYDAKIIGYDESNDIAVLKIDATDLTPVVLGDSDTLNVGDSVVAIGDPLGVTLRGTSTALAQVNEENLRVVADLTNVSDADGVYTVPATVYVDGLDVGAVGSYQVTVRLSGGAENSTEHN